MTTVDLITALFYEVDEQLPAFCAMKEDSHWGEKCSKVHSCKGYIPSQRANERKCPLGERSAPCTSIRR